LNEYPHKYKTISVPVTPVVFIAVVVVLWFAFPPIPLKSDTTVKMSPQPATKEIVYVDREPVVKTVYLEPKPEPKRHVDLGDGKGAAVIIGDSNIVVLADRKPVAETTRESYQSPAVVAVSTPRPEKPSNPKCEQRKREHLERTAKWHPERQIQMAR
jgi:hypothetical protein